MKLIKYIFPFLAALALFACGDDKDEPQSDKNSLVGYWALSHIKSITQSSGNHITDDMDIQPSYLESVAGFKESPRWNVLIFDEDFVTVRGQMPNSPMRSDYDDSIDGEVKYLTDFEQWNESIGTMTDEYVCPVGSYSIKNNDLIIGSLNMGKISFVTNDEFTLDYKKSIDNSDDYQRLIFTYTRIYSLF